MLREELKNVNWHLYGLKMEDLNYTFRLVKDIIEGRKILLDQERKRLQKECVEDITGEIISDIAYYTWVENQYLWHFCLWRMQAIFEHIVVREFLPVEPSNTRSFFGGLRKLIREIIDSGYQIAEDELIELFEWSRLRNALSHQPPEMYNPSGLGEADIIEYADLLKRILRALFSQKENQGEEM